MDKGEKKQKIQWDEETIAEHDKERGSRQKIDEAPTPFRYQSESDQSECESDAEMLAKQDLEDANAEAVCSENSPHIPPSGKKKGVSSIPTNPNTSVCDSWEAINAKLQYEKHLQDNGAPLSVGKPSINDSVQRSQFYQHSGSNSNNNFGSHTNSQGGSPRVTMASGNKIMDLQSNFGEILNPAPAAFSPQFTKKNYRLSGGKHSILTISSASADDESGGGQGPGSDTKRKALLSPEKAHKSVFIKAFGDGESSGEAMGDATNDLETHRDSLDGHTSNGEDLPSGEKKQFLNKRAGHYNEFKVLQAMRAKLAAEGSDEDETDP